MTAPSPPGGPGAGPTGAPALADQARGDAPVRLRDVVPLRYRLPEGTPEVLGDLGGQARIKAFDSETGSAVFIKVAEDGATIPREAEVLTRLDHPAIVRLKRWGRGGGAAFLILDLVDAPDLETVLRRRRGRLGVNDVKALLAALCPGIAAIHTAGCLHRDLKPANILVPNFSTPVIADFGAAAPMERAGSGVESWLTDGYAAPEQYQGGGHEGPWTDLYGLAATAYRALTGSPPPPAPARLAGAWMMPAVTAVSDDGMELAAAIDRALGLDPERRPQSAEAWADMLGVRRLAPTHVAAPARQLAPSAAPERPDPSPAVGNGMHDEAPPTVPVRRSAGQRPATAVAAAPERAVPVAPPRRGRLRWIAPLALLVLALVATGFWAGRPFYERYLKREWLVAQDGRGDATTIGDALRRAGDAATILVGNGTFVETLAVNRPLQIVAAEGAAPVIAPPDGPCLVVRGEGATITGLSLRGAAVAEPSSPGLPCVVIASGTPKLQDSQISSPNGPAILVRDGARPLLQRNTVSDTASASIVIRSGAEPTILENTIRGSGSVVFSEGAKGTFQNNTVSGSRASGLQIRAGADPRVVGNTIEATAEAGIYVYDSGRGYIEDNRILGSTLSGIVVAGGAAPTLIGNAISASGEHGIIILDASGGAIDRNIITANKGNGLVLSPESTVELGANQLEGNAMPQLVDARGGAAKP